MQSKRVPLYHEPRNLRKEITRLMKIPVHVFQHITTEIQDFILTHQQFRLISTINRKKVHSWQHYLFNSTVIRSGVCQNRFSVEILNTRPIEYENVSCHFILFHYDSRWLQKTHF